MQAVGIEARRELMLDALYDSLIEYPMWQSFLPVVRDAFGCVHASLVFGPRRTEQGELVLFVDDDAILEPVSALCHNGFFEDLPLGCAVVRDAPIGSVSDGYTKRALVLSLDDESGPTACLALWQNAAQDPFDDEALTLMNGMAAPIKRGVKLFKRIAELERKQIVSSAAIETANIGVILVNSNGDVLLTNSIADALINAGDVLQVVHGRLRTLTTSDTILLMGHIRRQAAEQQAEADLRNYTPVALQRSDTLLPLTVIVRPGPAFRPLKNPLMRTAMLILRDPEHRPIIPGSTLARLFGLTPAEAGLASELARGASLEEAAEHLDISRNTARTQLQSVFMKTGANRQGELVRMLLSSAAALSK